MKLKLRKKMTKEELKTLKDIIGGEVRQERPGLYCTDMKRPVNDAVGKFYFEGDLRQEAIKWISRLREILETKGDEDFNRACGDFGNETGCDLLYSYPGIQVTINVIRNIFNITKEDLK